MTLGVKPDLREMVYEELAKLPGWQEPITVAMKVGNREGIRPEWIDQSCGCVGQRIQLPLVQNALTRLQNQGRVETKSGIRFRVI